MDMLTLSPEMAADLECKVGEEKTLTITGTVTKIGPDGSVTIRVSDAGYDQPDMDDMVADMELQSEVGEQGRINDVPPVGMAYEGRPRKSAVMKMAGRK